jgi:hypothetical protein
MSASFAWVIWNSASAWPNNLRPRALANASSSARRANPSAAPATVVRKISRPRMASLKPCPGSPSSSALASFSLTSAMGCGATISIRCEASTSAASTMKALMPSSARAKTT